MKYIVAFLGLTIIVLRTIGFEIDITSIGLFIFTSFILLIKDFAGLRQVSGFGVTVEFDKALKKLANDTEKLEEQIQEKKINKGLSGPPEEVDHLEDNIDHEIETEYTIHIDSKNPKLTLINLAIEIERNLRGILSQYFGDDSVRPISALRMADKVFDKAFDKIEDKNNYMRTFKEFWMLRNSIIHSDKEVPDDKIISLIDSGLRILKVLKAIDNNLDNGILIQGLS